jgi:hypothetical protein
MVLLDWSLRGRSFLASSQVAWASANSTGLAEVKDIHHDPICFTHVNPHLQ